MENFKQRLGKLSRLRGYAAEQAAANYLKQQGLRLIETNYRTKMGEIDLIMQDGDCLIFVEVRLRSPSDRADALHSVDYKKQTKLCKTALYYMQTKQLLERHRARFDVLAITANDQQTWHFDWRRDAFQSTLY